MTPWAIARQTVFLLWVANVEVAVKGSVVVRNWHFVDVKPIDQTDFNPRFGLVRASERGERGERGELGRGSPR